MIIWLKKETKTPNWLWVFALMAMVLLVSFNLFIYNPTFKEVKIDAGYLCRSPYSLEPCLSDVYYPDIDVACFYNSEGDIFDGAICIRDFQAKRLEYYEKQKELNTLKKLLIKHE